MTSSYANSLWNKLDLVVAQSIDRRKQMEDFINAISKRIEIQEIYSKNIYAVGCMMDKYLSRKSSASFTYSAFKSDHLNRAQQSKVLVTSLKDEVLTMLRTTQQNQNNDWKRLQKDAKKLQKQMQEHSEKIIAAKTKLNIIQKQRQQQLITMQILKSSIQGTLNLKQKQQIKIRDCEKQFKDYEFVYRNNAKQYNQFLLGYQNQLQKVLTVFQKHQEQRLQKQVDTIMKILVFETAMMRNFDYDIGNISQQMQTITSRDDVISFIKQNSDNSKIRPYALVPEVSLLTLVVEKIGSKQFQERLNFQKNQVIRSFIETHFKQGKIDQLNEYNQNQKKQFDIIIQFVAQCWKNKSIPIENIHGTFKQLMENTLNRSFFQLAFRFYGSHFSLELLQKGYSSSLRLFQASLDKSFDKKDIFTIRKLLNLIFSHWTMDPPRLSEEQLEKIQTMSMAMGDQSQYQSKPKRKLLYSGLTHLQIWRNSDLWQSIIIQSIQQQLIGLHQQKGQTIGQRKAKQKNVVLSQLASYSHIMIMLGTTPKNVRLIIGRYCRLYNLGQQQNKDLSKTISQTWKVYKELHSKQSKNEGDMKKKQQRVSADFRS